MTTTTSALDGLLAIRDDSSTARWNFSAAVGTPVSNPGGIGQAAALTYSFLVGVPHYYTTSGFEAFSTAQQNATRSVLEAFAAVAHVSFAEVTGVGDVTFGMESQGGSDGQAYYPSYGYSFDQNNTILSVTASEVGGDVWLNSSVDWQSQDFDLGKHGFGTLVHELGHALGLKHSFEGGFTLTPELDNQRSTVMAYTPHPQGLQRVVTSTGGGGYSIAYYPVSPETPMLLDILALQYLYGANTSFHTGDDVYTFDPARPFIRTLWDAGGTDTISIANFTNGSVIDLTEGSYSALKITLQDVPPGFTDPEFARGKVYDGTDNLAIAFGTVIENAIGGSGNDLLRGNGAANNLVGGGGRDTLLGGLGNDTLQGGAGDDSLDGGIGIDLADYSGATDAVRVDLRIVGSQLVSASQGSDSLSSIENLLGSAFDDLLTGDLNANWLRGREGNDTIQGGAGNDNLDGGIGFDTADYSAATSRVTAELWRAFALVDGQGGQDSLLGFERLIGSSFDDLLAGSDTNEAFIGGAGHDGLYASGGQDTLVGGAGNDTLDGGAGFDVANYSSASTGVTAELWRFLALGDGDGGRDALWNIEALVGSAFNDILAGNAANESFAGGAGNDGIYAANGTDTLVGGAGNDTLDGGGGVDLADYSASQSSVTAELWRSFALNDGLGGQDALWNIEGLLGSPFNDVLGGNGGNESFIGGAGNDGIYAAGGNDTLIGGTGVDTLDGGLGNDVVDYSSASSGVIAELWQAFALNDGQGGQDALWNIENLLGSAHADLLAGTEAANLLWGQAGADQIYGGGGSDTLTGGAGSDTLYGGAGPDLFVFDSELDGNMDTLQDFNAPDDTIQLARAIFGALGSPGPLAAGMFRSGAGVMAAADANDHLIYNSTSGSLLYDADGVGLQAPIQFARLGIGLSLTDQDFVVA